MRTTFDLPDELMRHLKVRAATEGRSLRDLVQELIERGLGAPAVAPAGGRVPPPLPVLDFGQRLPKKYLSNAGLFELIHEADDE